MSYGYLGKIIRINLTNDQIKVEKPDDIFYRTYIGGKGFVAYFLLKELMLKVDPLGPENKLIFAAGVLTGLPVAAMPRFAVGAKSPLTEGYGQSEAGGFWGPELKKAGYDALIVEGKARSPVYIYINDNRIEIKDAAHLWGKETGEAQDIIRNETGVTDIRVSQIGIAGENLVRYACIVNELKHINGRNGLGAVMGSKNLKAVAVKGSRRIPLADEDTIKKIGKTFVNEYLMDHPLTRGLYEYGTSATVTALNAAGILPTKNFVNGEFEGAKNISAETMNDTILKSRKGCYACAIRCKRVVEVQGGDFSVDPRYGGPEYETLGAFGSLCCIDDLGIIAKANELCNKYGLDTISTGASIAFAMECQEKGILTRYDLDGVEVSFGNSGVLLGMIEKIARRQGIGDILAEGSARAARRIGGGADKCIMTVKGQELPMHDPRGKVGVAIGYAVSETGSDHMVSAHDIMYSQKGIVFDSLAPFGILETIDIYDLSEKKLRAFIYMQQWWSFFNMAGICDFGPVPRGSIPAETVVDLLRAATGWDTSLFEIMKAGERSINMARLYNLREGFTRDDDTLPERLFEPLQNGRLKGKFIAREEFQTALSTYYLMMGWDEDGVPTNGKLAELNIGSL